MSSTMLTLGSTCSMRPTSVLVCRFRTLFRRMAVNMLQISAWQPMLQCSNSSTMQLMLSASWIMKFVSKSNSPPTSCGIRWNRGWEKIGFLRLSPAILIQCSVDINSTVDDVDWTKLSDWGFLSDPAFNPVLDPIFLFLWREINQEDTYFPDHYADFTELPSSVRGKSTNEK